MEDRRKIRGPVKLNALLSGVSPYTAEHKMEVLRAESVVLSFPSDGSGCLPNRLFYCLVD